MQFCLQFKPPPLIEPCKKKDWEPLCRLDGASPLPASSSVHRLSEAGHPSVIPQRLRLGDSANLDDLGSHGVEESFTVDPVQVRVFGRRLLP